MGVATPCARPMNPEAQTRSGWEGVAVGDYGNRAEAQEGEHERAVDLGDEGAREGTPQIFTLASVR